MSAAATQWAWRQALKSSTKIVLLALADRANSDGECWPSIPRLVADVCADRKTVLAAIKQLEADALIRVARSSGGGNRYCLLVDHEGQQTDAENGTSTDFGTGSESGTTPVPKTGLPSTENGTGTSPKNGTLNLKEESNNNLPFNLPGLPDESVETKSMVKANIEKQFQIAWSHYPARSGGNSEARARKAFHARIVSGIDAQELIDGVRRYAAWCDATGKTGTEFVKQAATFFGPDLHFKEPLTIPSTPATGAKIHAQKPKSTEVRSEFFSAPTVGNSANSSSTGTSDDLVFSAGSDLSGHLDQ